MKLNEKALNFAIRAHEGQIEKTLPTMVVGNMLKRYGFDDNVVAAGYLYTVVENTDYTIDDIAHLFCNCGKVTSLLMTATEPNKNLSIEEQIKQKIKAIKDLPLNNKAVITAIEIAKLEKIIIDENNDELTNQKTYYEEIYDALAIDFNHPILKRLYVNIETVFYQHKQPRMNPKFLKLNAQIKELNILKDVLESFKPYIVEFTGTNRVGQVLLIDIITDFFKDNFKIKVANELDNPHKEHIADNQVLSKYEQSFLIAAEIEGKLLSEISDGHDILLVNEGIFNILIWMQRYYEQGGISREMLEKFLDYYQNDLSYLINYAVVSYDSAVIIGEKDHQKSNDALQSCISLLNGNSSIIDINNSSYQEIALKVLENLLPIMHSDYVDQLKLLLENKKQ